MNEVNVIPIRGKPRTLERTMMDSGCLGGGRKARAMGLVRFFKNLYTWT